MEYNLEDNKKINKIEKNIPKNTLGLTKNYNYVKQDV